MGLAKGACCFSGEGQSTQDVRQPSKNVCTGVHASIEYRVRCVTCGCMGSVALAVHARYRTKRTAHLCGTKHRGLRVRMGIASGLTSEDEIKMVQGTMRMR